MIARVQQQLASLVSAPRGKQVKQRYAFWETQPVVQFSDTNAEVRVCCVGVFRARVRARTRRPRRRRCRCCACGC
jgi:hypothetical protein